MALYIGTPAGSDQHCHAEWVALSNGRSGSQEPEYSIAIDSDDTLVFAEVKYRHIDAAAALEAVTPAKRRQISRIALFYLNHMKAGTDLPSRFDVIGIDGDGNISHIENAFDFIQ